MSLVKHNGALLRVTGGLPRDRSCCCESRDNILACCDQRSPVMNVPVTIVLYEWTGPYPDPITYPTGKRTLTTTVLNGTMSMGIGVVGAPTVHFIIIGSNRTITFAGSDIQVGFGWNCPSYLGIGIPMFDNLTGSGGLLYVPPGATIRQCDPLYAESQPGFQWNYPTFGGPMYTDWNGVEISE